MRPERATALRFVADEGLGAVRSVAMCGDDVWLATSTGVFRTDASLRSMPERVDPRPATAVVASRRGVAALVGAVVHLDAAGTTTLDAVEGHVACSFAWSADQRSFVAGFRREDADWSGPGVARVVDREGGVRWEVRREDACVVSVAFGVKAVALGWSSGVLGLHARDGAPLSEHVLGGEDHAMVALRFEGDALTVACVDDELRATILRVHADALARKASARGSALEAIDSRVVTSHGGVALGPAGRVAIVTPKGKKHQLAVSHDGKTRALTLDAIERVAFSADGAALVVVRPGAVRVVTADKLKVIAKREVGLAWYQGLVVSDRAIATWGLAPEVLLWSTETGRIERRVPTPAQPTSAVFLPGGDLLVGTPAGIARSWGAVPPELAAARNVLGFVDAQTIAFSAGRREQFQPELLLFDLESDAVRSFCGGRGDIVAVSSSPDRRWLLVATAGGRAVCFSRRDGAIVRTFAGSAGSSPWAVFSPVWPTIAVVVSDDDGAFALQLVDVPSGEPRTIAASRGVTPALVFSPDGKRLLVRRATGCLLVDVDRAAILGELEGGGHASFSPDGSLLALASRYAGDRFSLFDRDGLRLATYDVGGALAGLAFGPSGSFVATATMDGAVRVYREG